nr:hypothetical protein GCM10020093_064910 [Planobispora longispora]
MRQVRPLPSPLRAGTTFSAVAWAVTVGHVLAFAFCGAVALREEELFWWPPVSSGAALCAGTIVLVRRVRRFRRPVELPVGA